MSYYGSNNSNRTNSYGLIIILILIILLIVLLLMEVPRYTCLPEDIEEVSLLYTSKPKYEDLLINKSFKIPKTVITLSTTPDRIHYLKPTLVSLLTQTIKVDEIVINIPYISRKGIQYEIPKWLSRLTSISIYRVGEDEGPATKILPTLRRENNNTIVIAVDDDNVYSTRTTQMLISEYLYYNKQCAITNYGIKLKSDLSFPYRYDRLLKVMTLRREVDLVQGCSGFLVTKSMFPKHVFNIKKVMVTHNITKEIQVGKEIVVPKECHTTDDIWISGWLAYNKVKIMMPAFNLRYVHYPNTEAVNNTESLIKTVNADGERNRIALEWFRDNFQIEFGNK